MTLIGYRREGDALGAEVSLIGGSQTMYWSHASMRDEPAHGACDPIG